MLFATTGPPLRIPRPQKWLHSNGGTGEDEGAGKPGGIPAAADRTEGLENSRARGGAPPTGCGVLAVGARFETDIDDAIGAAATAVDKYAARERQTAIGLLTSVELTSGEFTAEAAVARIK